MKALVTDWKTDVSGNKDGQESVSMCLSSPMKL